MMREILVHICHQVIDELGLPPSTSQIGWSDEDRARFKEHVLTRMSELFNEINSMEIKQNLVIHKPNQQQDDEL